MGEADEVGEAGDAVDELNSSGVGASNCRDSKIFSKYGSISQGFGPSSAMRDLPDLRWEVPPNMSNLARAPPPTRRKKAQQNKIESQPQVQRRARRTPNNNDTMKLKQNIR